MPKLISDEQLLEHVFAALVAHGYEGATTKAIAAASGVNEVTLFRKYGNKTNLVLAAVQQEITAFGDAGITYSGEVAADMGRIVSFYNTLFASRGRAIPVIVSELPRRPELRDGMLQVVGMLGQVGTLLARYQAEGELVQEPLLHALAALLAPLLTLHIVRSLAPDEPLPDVDIDAYVAYFLNGRRPAKGG